MREIEPPFELELEGRDIKITEHEFEEKRVFHIDFQGWKKPLRITVASNIRNEKFWTSIPQGRQKEAEQIGRLIATYIRNKIK